MHPTRFLPALLICISCAAQRRATSEAVPAGPVMVGRHPQALAVLESATTDTEPGVRAAALAARIRMSPEPAGGAWGPRALFDPSPWVRRAAADALARRLPEPDSATALATLVSRPDVDAYTRCGAAMHLARAGDRTTLPDVEAAMARASGGWETAPCALAAAVMGSEAALPVLEASLREGELPLELGFVADLAGSGLTDMAPAVGEAVALVEEPMRIPLAAAWMELGGSGGTALLRDALVDGTLEEQMTVGDFLMHSDSPDALDLLKRASGGAEPARSYARMILGARSGDVGAAQSSAVDEADRDARVIAMMLTGELIARLDDPRSRVARKAHAILLAGLADPDDAVRLAAVRAVTRVGTPEAASSLESLLESEGAVLRVAAAEALLQTDAGDHTRMK